MIYAKIIADSVSPTGSRLTTIECQFHRFILPEVNTHRAFSRNSASSRAIPTRKLIEQVRTNPAIPLEFGSNQPGMQAGPEVESSDGARRCWSWWADDAADNAETLLEEGVHKQVVNRLLEPFMWHKAIITSTQAGWENFIDQRLSALAQPEIFALAENVNRILAESSPDPINPDGWHLPYIADHDFDELNSAEARAVSAARCARVSYLTHDGERDVQKDLELYDKLISADPPHWSPLEHVATPAAFYQDCAVANLDGWAQLRHLQEYQ